MTKLLKLFAIACLAMLSLGALSAQSSTALATGTITTQNLVSAGTCTTGGCVEVGVTGESSLSVQVTGTYTGALSAQVTLNGSTWVTLGSASTFTRQSTGVATATITSGQQDVYAILFPAGALKVRISALAAVTGNAAITLQTSTSGGGVSSGGGSGGGGASTIADGVDVALGATADSASGADSAGTVNAHLRELTKASVQLPAGMGQTTASLSLPVVQASDATPTVAQGSATSGQKVNLTQGAVTTAAPSYTTGQTSPMSLDPAGNLRVLDATVATLKAPVSPATATATSSLLTGCQYNSVGVALTNGQQGSVQCDAIGGVKVSPAEGTTVTGTLTATGNLIAQQWFGFNSVNITITSAGTATVTYEFSDDSTNGTDGTWNVLVGTNPAVTAAAPATSYSATSSAIPTKFARVGKWFRARVSAYTSGTVTGYATFSYAHVPGVTLVAVGNSVAISNAQSTQGGAIAASPLVTAIEVRTTAPTTVGNTLAARPIGTALGVQVIRQDSIPELEWTYAAAASGISNTTTAVTIKAAGTNRLYLKRLDLMCEALGTATEVAIRDGAGGAVLWRTKVGTAGQPLVNIPMQPPLRGTAATLMEIVTLTASGTGACYPNAGGYDAP